MSEATTEGRFCIDLPDSDAAIALTGSGQSTLHRLESLTGASFALRGLQLEIKGNSYQLERAAAIVELVRPIWQEGQIVSPVDLHAAAGALDNGKKNDHAKSTNKVLAKSQRGNLLRPRTIRQKAYVEAIENFDLTFAIGPAGTGKTFLATVLAARLLTEKKIDKIILTRPAVEAGENLGFLPGDLQQKVDPYLRPLFDSLHSIFGLERTNSLIDKGVIEVAPLAFMRGRTLENSIVILDEAQNTTNSQMRMFLTRLGERSKMVVNGDITQIDLGKGQVSGLVEAERLFSGVEGIKICYLNVEDVVRHPLVQKIIQAYD